MRHLYREKNGRYYVRLQFPKAFQRSHPHLVPKSAEIRLSLYSTNHVHARELANAYWLASRKLVHIDLQALGILTIEDFKSHLRRSVTTHLPQKFTPLIELIGSTETAKIVIAVKTLSAFNAVFFVLPPPSVKGTISRKVITSSRASWDWIKLASVNEQQLPHMRLPAQMLQDAITAGQDWIEPDHLLSTVNGEKQMLSLAVKWRVGLHQLFISADLPQHIYTAVRKLTDTPPVSRATVTDVAVRPSALLSKEIEAYLAYKKSGWTPKSHDEFAMQLRVFLEMVTDKEILQLTSKDYQFYIQNLPRWPKSASKNKLYKGKNARDIASMPDPENIISVKTMETYCTTVTGFIRWAADRDENKGMNTSILRMKPQTNQVKGDGYVAFTSEQLSTIFESDRAISFLEKTRWPYQKFIGPLGLFLGCRLDEICSLQTNQVGTENGIHYIEIRKGKTENAVRKVPLAVTLIQLGFIDYWKYKKSLGEKRLFPECAYVHKHGYKKAASRWFGEFLDHLGITDKKFVFHSFRHNVSNILNEVDTLKSWRISRYLGHAIPPGASESERSYFKQRKLEHLLPVVEELKYSIDWAKYTKLTAQMYIK